MPNHVHLIAVPLHLDGLREMLGEVHRRYTKRINQANQWTGHILWGRFASVAMDENHLLHAFRYVAMYPVRARLVMKAEDWRWSSATAHLDGKPDGLTKIVLALSRVI